MEGQSKVSRRSVEGGRPWKVRLRHVSLRRELAEALAEVECDTHLADVEEDDDDLGGDVLGVEAVEAVIDEDPQLRAEEQSGSIRINQGGSTGNDRR